VVAFSPGVVQGCVELLGIASRNALSFPEISSSFTRLGGLPSGKVIDTAQSLKWLRASEAGIATITPVGSRLLTLSGYEPMLRQALLDYVEVERPAWVQNAIYGRLKVLSFAGTEIAQIFIEAGLAHGNDDATVSFWDAMAAMARGQENDRMLEIGREGERLTLAYELSRTGKRPKWISIESNEDGYDVLSIVADNDPRSLSIEVKASRMGLFGNFYLTRNEWERALDESAHAFHLWDIRSKPTVAVLSAKDVLPHVPANQGSGAWELACIPMGTFAGEFIEWRS
jgi:hypothetical protein